MIYNSSFKLRLLPIALLLVIGCNNESKPTDTETVDTTAISKMETAITPPYDVSRSVTTVAPNLYKQLSDTLGIRILECTYRPGDSSIVHAHPDFALYVLEGGTAELTSTDGKKETIEFIKDMAVVLPAATHSAKNIGKTTVKLIVVEVNRPR
jgi:quercetin dioxygenase-like cupin family protein